MFKLTQTPTFKAPVQFMLQGEDGKPLTAGFTGIFKRHTQAEVDALVQAGTSDRATAEKVLVGWEDGPADDQDVPLPFSQDNLHKLLDGVHGSAKVIARTFYDYNSSATLKN